MEEYAINLCGTIDLKKCTTVWNFKDTLHKQTIRKRITLWWVPMQEGIEVKEKASTLTKECAKLLFNDPDPSSGLLKSHIKNQVKIWEEFAITPHWRGTPGQKQEKTVLSPASNNAKVLLTFNKDNLIIVTGPLTGHCPLKYHLHRTKKPHNRPDRLIVDKN